MKKTITSFIVTIWFAMSLNAQTTDTFILNPQDEDATIDDYAPGNNHPNEIEYFSGTWTIGGTPTTWRNFFKFNLTCIPPNAEILSASLSLFYADTNSFSNATDTSLTSSNESVIRRVTSAWYEDSITWFNQPATTTNDEVILPASTSSTQDYTNLDVTLMVQQMVSNPNENWGFLLRQVTEVEYGRLLFASSDNPHQSKHPTLTVTYTIPTTDCFMLTLDANGEDATIDDYVPGNNHPDEIEYFSGTWTIGGTPTTWRNFFKFNLPCDLTDATVQSAHLNLYYATVNNFSNADHQSLSHSNESVISRVVSPWTEHTINWNNQPTVTTADEVNLAQSTTGNQDYLNIDVTAMVQRMITYPDSNFGFLLRVVDETPYARMLFASGDNPVTSKHPTIEVCYSLPSGINEVRDPFQVSIYPNPAHDAAYITADINGTDPVAIILTDMVGKSIKSEKINASLLNNFRFEFPENISKGIYFITLQNASGIVSKKLIIN